MVRNDSCPAYVMMMIYGVPYLNFNNFVIYIDLFGGELYAHGGVAISQENIIDERV